MIALGAQCTVDVSSFSITGSLQGKPTTTPEVRVVAPNKRSRQSFEGDDATSLCGNDESDIQKSTVSSKATVLQQAPGSLLMKTSLLPGQILEEKLTGQFSAFSEQVDVSMRKRFKTKSRDRKRAMHARNKYAEKSPDFSLLASLYPSFANFVVYGTNGKPRIDWTDFNATRELTRVLLEHDYNVKWWIPDGQLCPTVPNRANYIHWIEDLLTACPAPWHSDNSQPIKGLDIGTGANCIYPLLGASLHGWHFVGTDVTFVALDSAKKNVERNLHLAELVEIRAVSAPSEVAEQGQENAPVLDGVIREDETFDFCMCNPPFFEDISEANANPRTACGGTREEMVCQGGEAEFIKRIIDDSAVLKNKIQWYTSMVGRKTNLKELLARLRSLGVTMLRTTEFVQGRTSRWGIAWSFSSPLKAIAEVKAAAKISSMSFMLEGLGRQWTAADVLHALGSEMIALGAQCTVDVSSFSIRGSLQGKPTTTPEVRVVAPNKRSRESFEGDNATPLCGNDESDSQKSTVSFKATVLQQAPGSLLIKTSLLPGQLLEEKLTGQFSAFSEQVDVSMRKRFKTKSRDRP